MSGRPTFTLGIEEEFQTVDPLTRDLRSHIQSQIIAQGKMRLQERVKPEMHGSVVEVGTGICRTIADARQEVCELRRNMVRLAEENNLRLAAAGTHPFADWKTQEIFPDDRYRVIVEDMQQVARANLIFGLHVHIGIEDRETTIQLMNAARYFLPHILALSVNSPFWKGYNTGLKSYRCKVFDKFPRTNIPDYFQSYGEYENFVNLLIRTHCIDNAKKIWWDLRPHPFFGTLEFRICDIPCRAEETVAIAALAQALVARLQRLIESNLRVRRYARTTIEENKFRALKTGLDGGMIDFSLKREASTRDLLVEVLDFVAEAAAELGTRAEMDYLRTWATKGDTGADRQLRAFHASHDLRGVVDFLVDETKQGLV